MKLVHFEKLSAVQKAPRRGIKPQNKRNRLNGVYAVPVLNFPNTVINNWRRMLGSERHLRLGAIVFEIPDHEMVYFAPDWSHTAVGARNLITAREAEARTFELGRQRAEPLTPTQFEAMLEMGDGNICSYDQPSYNYNLMEIIVPRAITAGEVRRVILPDRRKRLVNKDFESDESLCELSLEEWSHF